MNQGTVPLEILVENPVLPHNTIKCGKKTVEVSCDKVDHKPLHYGEVEKNG